MYVIHSPFQYITLQCALHWSKSKLARRTPKPFFSHHSPLLLHPVFCCVYHMAITDNCKTIPTSILSRVWECIELSLIGSVPRSPARLACYTSSSAVVLGSDLERSSPLVLPSLRGLSSFLIFFESVLFLPQQVSV